MEKFVKFCFLSQPCYELYTERAQQLSKMATGEEKVFAVLECNVFQSIITMQRHFRTSSRKMCRVPTPFRNGMRNLKLQDAFGSISCGKDDKKLMSWPPRSPDLTPCYFLYGDMRKIVSVRPFPVDLPELRARIINAFQQINRDMLCLV